MRWGMMDISGSKKQNLIAEVTELTFVQNPITQIGVKLNEEGIDGAITRNKILWIQATSSEVEQMQGSQMSNIANQF